MSFIQKQINNAVEKVELLDALKQMRDDLQELGSIPNGIDVYDYAVKFFNITTSFNDKYTINQKLLNDTQEDARSMVFYIANTGSRFSYLVAHPQVRAQRGNIVTLKNLYLQDPGHAFDVRPIEFFKTCSDEKAQKVTQVHLSKFIASYREPMIASLTRIVRFNKKPNNFIVRRALEKRKQITK